MMGDPQQRREIGIPPLEELKGGLKKAFEENLAAGEKVRVCIEGGLGEALVATDRRVLVLKAGILSGAYHGPLCFAYPYEDIYLFKWGLRRSLEIIPYKESKLQRAIITFTPFQDKTFTGAVNFMAKKVVEVRKKKPQAGDAEKVVDSEGAPQ